MPKVKMVEEEWKYKELPKESGAYWFYGVRYKSLDDREKELLFCRVRRISNGICIVCEGHLLYESELGKDWWFKKATLPKYPPEIK